MFRSTARRVDHADQAGPGDNRQIRTKVVRGFQIIVEGCDRLGSEGLVLSVLTASRVEMFGSRLSTCGDERMVLVVVANGTHARRTLERAGFECRRVTPVLVVPPGSEPKFELIARLIRECIGIHCCYFLDGNDRATYMVLKTQDNDYTARVIEFPLAPSPDRISASSSALGGRAT